MCKNLINLYRPLCGLHPKKSWGSGLTEGFASFFWDSARKGSGLQVENSFIRVL